jgi:predicted RNA-binding Zn ribbon-like protein
MVRMGNKRQTVKHNRRAPLFRWSGHHFLNRNPALDLANTLVYRNRPDRREDRLRTIENVENWSRAGGMKLRPFAHTSLTQILIVRESIDRFFRRAAAAEEIDRAAWNRLMRLYASNLPGSGLTKTGVGLRLASRRKSSDHLGFLSLVLQAAVELALSPEFAKVKICPGCGWLFIDRTRNGTKRWCITSLCGNRNKLRRHYHRQRRGARLTAKSLSHSSSPP